MNKESTPIFKLLSGAPGGTTNNNSNNSTMNIPNIEMLIKENNSSFTTSEKLIPVSNNHSKIERFENEEDDIIKKIKLGIIFKEIRFIYNTNAYDKFENNLKVLKQTYEDKVDTLEKNMDYFKTYLENFYRKQIQQTRNYMDNMEFLNENLPIMNITAEHNEKLKMLRELYDNKLKELEQVR
jgi:hypothetical protein